jgi:ATP-dependent protease Clp ATPase subunit
MKTIPEEPAKSEALSKLHCGFCGKREKEVAQLVAGPNVSICNECIDATLEFFKENNIAPSSVHKMSLVQIREILLCFQEMIDESRDQFNAKNDMID